MPKKTNNISKMEEPSTSSQSSASEKELLSSSGSNSESSASNCEQTSNSNSSVKRKLRSLTFGRRKKSLQCFANNKCKDNNNCNNSQNTSNTNNCNINAKKKKTSGVWVPFKLCARTESCADITEPDNSSESCVCTAYKKTEETDVNRSDSTINQKNNVYNTSVEITDGINSEVNPNSEYRLLTQRTLQPNETMAINTSIEPYVSHSYGISSSEMTGDDQSPTQQMVSQSMMSEVRSVQVRVSELALALRSQLALTVSPYPYLARWGEVAELTPGFLNRFCVRSDSSQALNDCQQIHTQIDYIHCLVPDLLQITNCSFYWGKMDRYEAERLLDNKPEGTFLLRDSAQEEHLFSVSFRRFDRSLHARIEQWNHRFSFDSHDPGVYASNTVCGLIEHYKDPSHCMFFEPMLTIPLHRNFTFSLQHLSRSVITSRLTYDTIHSIQLPKRLKNYLKEYHYKQQVRVRRLDGDH